MVPFFVVVNSKKMAAKCHKFREIFSSRSLVFISCLRNAKTSSLKQQVDFFPSDFEFSFSAKFRDLLTYDDVIDVLICITSVNFDRVFQYKHFEVWHVVLWFTIVTIMTIFLSSTPKLSSGLNSERLTLWRHFWTYCRVTKSLPSFFCYAMWSSSWKWRETSRTIGSHLTLCAAQITECDWELRWA